MGMGGGTVLIPILTIFLGADQHIAQWINVVTFLPMSVVALIIHLKNKLIDKKKILPILLPALVTTALTAYFSTGIADGLLKKLFGGFLILLGLSSIIAAIIKAVKEKKLKDGKEEKGATNGSGKDKEETKCKKSTRITESAD